MSCLKIILLLSLTFISCLYSADIDIHASFDKDFYYLIYQLERCSDTVASNTLLKILLPYKQQVFNIACLNGHMKVASTFIKLPGVSLTDPIVDTFEPIHHAAVKGNISMIQMLLDNGIDIERKKQDDHSTPLLIAVGSGQDAVAHYLVKQGANMNVQLDDGATPLFLAAQEGRLELLKYLRGCGADPHIKRNNGEGLLLIASEVGHTSVVKDLLGQSTTNVNEINDCGVSPLLTASYCGHDAIVKLLLAAKGIEVDNRNIAGATPFFMAIIKGHRRIAEMLMKAGASCYHRSVVGEGIIHMGAISNSQEMLPFLLNRMAKDKKKLVNQRQDKGQTPLHYAAMIGFVHVVDPLLKAKANINAQDKYGKTPLFYACQYNRTDMLQQLLTYGADKNIADTLGCLPITIAQAKGYKDVVRLLNSHQSYKKGKKKAPIAVYEEELDGGIDAYEIASPYIEIGASLEHVAPSSSSNSSGEPSCSRYHIVKVDPSLLFNITGNKITEKDPYVIIEDAWNHACKLLIIYKDQKQDHHYASINLSDAYKEQDMFHGFSEAVDAYIGYSLQASHYVNSELLREYAIHLKDDEYALVLAAKIVPTTYDCRYIQQDRDYIERGHFDGAFVYLCNKDGVCFHRMFHQNRISKAINTGISSS